MDEKARHGCLLAGFFISTLLLFAFQFVTPCTALAEQAEESSVSVKPIRLGALLALTGPFADTGEDCRRGIEVARLSYAPDNRAGQFQIEILYGDSQADPKVGVSEFRKLVDEQQISALITMRSPIGLAINPISKAKGIPVLGAVGHGSFAAQNDYAFQMWSHTKAEAVALATEIHLQGFRRVAMVTSEDDWTLEVSDYFKQAFADLGGTIAYADTVLATEADFAPIATKFRSANADALFVNLGLRPGALAIKRIREQGLNQKIFSNFWSADPSVASSVGAATLEGVSFVEARLGYPKFIAALEANFAKKRVSFMTLSCYSSMSFFLEALKRLPPTASGSSAEVYRALLETPAIPLLDGELPIEDRRGQFALAIKTIQGGTAVEP